MTQDYFVIDGVRWVTVDAIARCYTVKIEWVREVVELGLVDTGVEREGTITIRASELERVAKIVQLHFYQGIELSSVRVLLR